MEQSVQALRFRKLDNLSIAVLIPNKFFLIPLTIKATVPFAFELHLPSLMAQSQATTLTINPKIEIFWQDESQKTGLLASFFKKLLMAILKLLPLLFFTPPPSI